MATGWRIKKRADSVEKISARESLESLGKGECPFCQQRDFGGKVLGTFDFNENEFVKEASRSDKVQKHITDLK